MPFKHETVLLHETIDQLNIKADGLYVDCTFGGGGHARYLLDQLNDQGRLFAFDQDMSAIENGQKQFAAEIAAGKLVLIHSNFSHLKAALNQLKVEAVDGIYYDLGVSSPQLDVAERGFSYHQTAPLDMRMDQSQPLTAYEVVNEWGVEDLRQLIRNYGEERFAQRIAQAIDRHRQSQPIETTTQLAEIVKLAIPAATRRKGGHPAKRTFQAIRIAVNNELGVIEASLEQALDLLASGGRLNVISFHSLEDRLVKQLFKKVSTVPPIPRNLPILPSQEKRADFNLVTRQPISASEAELAANNRARSAKLRVIEKN